MAARIPLVPAAPSDGKQYIQKNGAWVEPPKATSVDDGLFSKEDKASLDTLVSKASTPLVVLATANLTANGDVSTTNKNYFTFSQTTASIKATILAPTATTTPSIITVANIGTTEITLLSKVGGTSIKLGPKTTMDLNWGVAAAEWLPTGGGVGGANNTIANTWHGYSSAPKFAVNETQVYQTRISATGDITGGSTGPLLKAGRTYLVIGEVNVYAGTDITGYSSSQFVNVTSNTLIGEPRWGNAVKASVNGATVAWTMSEIVTPTVDMVVSTRIIQATSITGSQSATITAIEVASNNVTVNGVQAEYGEILIPDGTVSTNSGSNWVVVDLSNAGFTLPSAGVWEVDYEICYSPSNTANETIWLVRDSSNNIVSGTTSSLHPYNGSNKITVRCTFRVTVSSPTTYKLSFKTPAAGNVTISNTNTAIGGTSRIQWKKISGFLPVSASGVMVGATASTTGSAGVVPVPIAGEQSKLLKGNGTWAFAGSDVVHGYLSQTNVVFGSGNTKLVSGVPDTNTLGISASAGNVTLPAGKYRIEFRGSTNITNTDTGQQGVHMSLTGNATLVSGLFHNQGFSLYNSGSNTALTWLHMRSNGKANCADTFSNVFYVTVSSGTGVFFLTAYSSTGQAASSSYGAVVGYSITQIG